MGKRFLVCLVCLIGLGLPIFGGFYAPHAPLDLKVLSQDRPVVAVLEGTGWSRLKQRYVLKALSRKPGLTLVNFVLIPTEYASDSDMDDLIGNKAVLYASGQVVSEFSSRFCEEEFVDWISDTLYPSMTTPFSETVYTQSIQTGQLMLVYFSAEYGPDSHKINPVVLSFMTHPEWSPSLTIYELDYDRDGAYRRQFGVTTPDTLVLIQNGSVIKRWPREENPKKVARYIQALQLRDQLKTSLAADLGSHQFF